MHRFVARLDASVPGQPARGKLNFYEGCGKPGFSGGRRPFAMLEAAIPVLTKRKI
jgi:hypothetical protein